MAFVGLAVVMALAPQVAGGDPAWLAAAAGFTVAGVAALRFPLSLSLMNRVTVASSVFFSGLLVLPPAEAALSAGAALVIDSVISLARVIQSGQRRPSPAVFGLSVSFNAAAAVLSIAFPALLLPAGRITFADLSDWQVTLPSAVAAGILMYLLNLTLVGVAVALKTGTRPVQTIAIAMRPVRMEFLALYAIGLVAAFVLMLAPWAVILLAPATIVGHHFMERAVQLRRETVAAVERMADLVDRRDPYTADHSRRVARYVVALARELGMTAPDTEQLRLAATVHDIGKIETPDEILLKSGRLTAEEQVVMEQHPKAGYDLLRQFSEYARVRELVLTHHERYDGKGYPSGLRGTAMPLIAQVIPVADTLDAMTSARPYRDPLPWSVALAEIARGRGTQWHPTVVDAALKVFVDRVEPEAKAA